MSSPLQIMMNSTGKFTQCIHRIASGCLGSSRMVASCSAGAAVVCSVASAMEASLVPEKRDG